MNFTFQNWGWAWLLIALLRHAQDRVSSNSPRFSSRIPSGSCLSDREPLYRWVTPEYKRTNKLYTLFGSKQS